MPPHAEGSTRSLWEELAPFLAELRGEIGAHRHATLARLWRRGVERPLRLFFARPGKSVRGNLANRAWTLERDDEPPPALALAVEAIHAGSLILDDIQDRSRVRRGGPTLHRRVGVPVALNVGSLLLWLPFDLLRRLRLAPSAAAGIQQEMTEVMLHCHFGQALDLAGDLAQIPQRGVGRVVKSAAGLKTARLMGLAAELGVAAAGADAGRFRVARGVGRNVGVGLQILNDLCDLAGEDDECKRFEDLRAGKPTWPWAVLAKSLSTAEYRRFLDELEAVRKGEAPPCGLARRLLTQTEDGCRRLAARAFRRAEADLDRTYGNVPAVHALIGEIARLERRYAQ